MADNQCIVSGQIPLYQTWEGSNLVDFQGPFMLWTSNGQLKAEGQGISYLVDLDKGKWPEPAVLKPELKTGKELLAVKGPFDSSLSHLSKEQIVLGSTPERELTLLAISRGCDPFWLIFRQTGYTIARGRMRLGWEDVHLKRIFD